MDLSTQPEAEPAVAGDGGDAECLPGFGVIWGGGRPEHLGAWFPIGHGTWILGRGLAQASDVYPRLEVFRQRPGVNLTLPALESRGLSRVQCLVERSGSGVTLENVGKCLLRVNGQPVRRAQLREEDVIELGSQLVLLYVRRPAALPVLPEPSEFGDPDAHGIVGESPAVWELRRMLAFVAPRREHVLIRGESGTGKELIAQAVHALSGRSGKLIARNAATLPEGLVDAELFGNAKAYPNAGMPERKGLVAAADGGTLFLDEFAELTPSQQTHLLRVLDDGEFQRLGETTMRRADVRFVAATNRPIDCLREDMAARFAFTIVTPSLRQRLEDVPLLARHLVRQIATKDAGVRERFIGETGEPRLSPALISNLIRHSPPGNIRGLLQVLWHSIAHSRGDTLEWIGAPEPKRVDSPGDLSPDAEQIQAALNLHRGSLEKTWKALGLSSRFVLMRLMKRHGIEVRRSAAAD